MPDAAPKRPRKKSKKRPCSICRRWFVPNPRVGARQRACEKPECQGARRKKSQAAWRKRNPDYFMGHRIQARGALLRQPPEPLRLPSPLKELPWDLAQSQFGVQGADFLGVMSKLILRAAQDQMRLYGVDSTTLPSKVLLPAVKDSIPVPADLALG